MYYHHHPKCQIAIIQLTNAIYSTLKLGDQMEKQFWKEWGVNMIGSLTYEDGTTQDEFKAQFYEILNKSFQKHFKTNLISPIHKLICYYSIIWSIP